MADSLSGNLSIRKHNKFIDASIVELKNPNDEMRPVTTMNDNKVLYACIAKMQLLYKDLSVQKIEEEARKKLTPIFEKKKDKILNDIAKGTLTKDLGDEKLKKLDYVFEIAMNQETRKFIKDTITTEYEFDISEIIKLTGISSNNAYYLRSRLSHLQYKEAMRVVEYTVDPDYENVEQEIVDIVLIPTIRTKRGSVAFEINRSATPYFFALTKNFTQLSLAYLRNFNSNNSLRLYEICQMIRKIQHNIAYTFEEIQQKFGTNYKEYRFFKAQILKSAIKEINEKSDIYVELIEHKKSKVVEKISFRVEQKIESGEHSEDVAIDMQNITVEKVARFITMKAYFKRINTDNKILDPEKYVRRMIKAIKDDTIPSILEDTESAKEAHACIPKIKVLLTLNQNLFSHLTLDEKHLILRTNELALNDYGYIRIGDTLIEGYNYLQQLVHEEEREKSKIVSQYEDEIRGFETIWERLASHGFVFKTVDGNITIDNTNIGEWKARMEDKVIKNPNAALMYFSIENNQLEAEFKKYVENLS